MTNKEKTEILLKWLDKRPALKTKIIEQESGIPFTTITQAQKKGREIPAHHWSILLPVLHKYGMDKKLIKIK